MYEVHFCVFHPGEYVFPEIHRFWSEHQQALLCSASEQHLQLAIDGQCDSPGHSATYCTVSAVDTITEKILDFNVVDVKEVKNSQGQRPP